MTSEVTMECLARQAREERLSRYSVYISGSFCPGLRLRDVQPQRESAPICMIGKQPPVKKTRSWAVVLDALGFRMDEGKIFASLVILDNKGRVFLSLGSPHCLEAKNGQYIVLGSGV